MPLDAGTALGVLSFMTLALLPGLAVLRLLRVTAADRAVHAGLAVAVGLALQPVAYLWLTALRLPAGTGFWRAALVAAAVVPAAGVVARAARGRAGRWRRPERAEPTEAVAGGPRAAFWPRAALVALLLLVGASRWWAAREVTVPLWGDSLHHTMIVRLMVLREGVPDDWQPLAPLASFTYHFGLHAGVATLTALTGWPEHRALLVAGQVLSVLQVLTAYALVAGLTGRQWAGVAAAVAAAGLSPMPAYYLNWGRYTQLAGQVLLPAAALAVAWAAGARAPTASSAYPPAGSRRGTYAAAALLAAGLALTHYLVALVYAAFVVAWLALGVGGAGRAGLRARGGAAVRVAAVAGGALMVVGPWLGRMADSVIARAARGMVTGGLADPEVYGVVSPSAIWGSVERLDANVGLPLLAAALVAAAYALRCRERVAVVGLGWTALLVLAAYPGLLGLAMTPPLKDFTVAIGLYVPLGLVIGGAFGRAADGAARGRQAPALAALIVGLAAALAIKDRAVVDARHVLVSPADERALAWIRGATPPESVFLVGCVAAFGNTVCAGDDAGWWIPLLAHRTTTVPPITYGLERAADPLLAARVNGLAELWRTDLDAPDTRRALLGAGVTHAYAGATGRALPRDRLAASPHWRLVHEDDGARVYALRAAAPLGGP